MARGFRNANGQQTGARFAWVERSSRKMALQMATRSTRWGGLHLQVDAARRIGESTEQGLGRASWGLDGISGV
jgi:hypothetical protein